MSKKLSEIIKELEDSGAINEYYFYRESWTGKEQLHVELNQDIAKNILDNIKNS